MEPTPRKIIKIRQQKLLATTSDLRYQKRKLDRLDKLYKGIKQRSDDYIKKQKYSEDRARRFLNNAAEDLLKEVVEFTFGLYHDIVPEEAFDLIDLEKHTVDYYISGMKKFHKSWQQKIYYENRPRRAELQKLLKRKYNKYGIKKGVEVVSKKTGKRGKVSGFQYTQTTEDYLVVLDTNKKEAKKRTYTDVFGRKKVKDVEQVQGRLRPASEYRPAKG